MHGGACADAAVGHADGRFGPGHVCAQSVLRGFIGPNFNLQMGPDRDQAKTFRGQQFAALRHAVQHAATAQEAQGQKECEGAQSDHVDSGGWVS